jgi:hypothetical protein
MRRNRQKSVSLGSSELESYVETFIRAKFLFPFLGLLTVFGEMQRHIGCGLWL